jgi:DNA repair photolyase
MLQQKLVKSVLNKHKKRDSWFLDDYSVNPYEGCSCNCLYCYIRGSKYGENLADSLSIKSNALEILDKQLAARAKKNQYGIVAVGTATDAYIHHEKEQQHTRGMLELLLKYRFPVFISTKCSLVLRDIDLLKEIDRQAILPDDLQHTLKRGVILSVSISSMDERVTNMLESGADTPRQRMHTLQQLSKEGFLTGVNAMPLLPYISDTLEEMEKIFAAAKEHGAQYIYPAGLTLFGNGPSDSKTLVFKFLERYNASLLPRYRQLYDRSSYTAYLYHDQLKKNAAHLHQKYNIRSHILAV